MRVCAIIAIISMLTASFTTHVARLKRSAEGCPVDKLVCHGPIEEPVAPSNGCCPTQASAKAESSEHCGTSLPCHHSSRSPQGSKSPCGEQENCTRARPSCYCKVIVPNPDGLKWEPTDWTPELIEAVGFESNMSIEATLASTDIVPPHTLHPIIPTTVLLM